MDESPMFGEYSPKMMWDTLLMTNAKIEEHFRIHKEDIDTLYLKIDNNAKEQRTDSTEIKQALAEISQSVSLLAQKIECNPIEVPAAEEPNTGGKTGGIPWITGAVIAILYGVSQFVEFVKK